MKKISYVTIALALSVLVACKGKDKKNEPADDNTDDMTEQVDTNASQRIAKPEMTTKRDTLEEEVFGTDLDDDKANKSM